MDPMDKRYDDYLDGDQRPPDQRTPPNTPPPQVEGGAHAAAATGTAFAVNAVWRMSRHPTTTQQSTVRHRNERSVLLFSFSFQILFFSSF